MSLNDILRELGFKPHKSNWLHFIVGAVVSICAFIISYYEWDMNWFIAILCGSGMAFMAGLIKEFWDKPNFDWLDLIMTTLGGIAGGLIISPITFVL